MVPGFRMLRVKACGFRGPWCSHFQDSRRWSFRVQLQSVLPTLQVDRKSLRSIHFCFGMHVLVLRINFHYCSHGPHDCQVEDGQVPKIRLADQRASDVTTVWNNKIDLQRN